MRFAVLFAAAVLSACAAAPATRPTVQLSLPPAQLYVVPQVRFTALPARKPPAIVQSQLLGMPQAEVAGWALPEHAAATTRVELVRGWMPEVSLGWFYETPFVTSYPGVCEVRTRGVNFRKHREGALTYEQHLDPPLEPYQLHETRRYRLLGSTLDGRAATAASCGAALPYADWFEAPSAHAVFMAVQHIDRARGWPRDFTLSCTEHGARPCEARAYLEKLTPNLIKRIDGVPCEGVLAARTHPDPCWRLTYHDPRSPGSGSEFHVLATAGVVALSQVLLPPH